MTVRTACVLPQPRIDAQVYALAVDLVEREGMKVSEAAARMGISASSLYAHLADRRSPAALAAAPEADSAGLSGSGRSLGKVGAAFVLERVDEHPAEFLYELVYALEHVYGITTDRRTVARFLISQGYSRKQMRNVDTLFSLASRNLVVNTVRDLGMKSYHVINTDEFGVNNLTAVRRFGRAQRGQRPRQVVNTTPGDHYNVYILITESHGVIADLCSAFTGRPSNTASYVSWFKVAYIDSGLLQRWPARNSCVFLDNWSGHNEAQLRDLVESVGGKIIFNAPKSPGDAPVEEAIGAVKSYLRFLEQPVYLKDPKAAITRALRSVTPQDVVGFFRGSPLFNPDADVARVLPPGGANAIREILEGD